MLIHRVTVAALIAACSSAMALGDTVVVPNAYENTLGTGSFVGPLANAARTYQMLIHADQLTAFIGQDLNGLSWRIPANASSAWPASDATYGNYDIYLAESVAPEDRSLNFADNAASALTQVRSGALNIAAGAFSSGGSPNDFGMLIDFNNGEYTYSGGHLLIEIRHTGSDSNTRSVESINASGGEAVGYGSQFAAVWQSAYDATSGNQGNFALLQLSSTAIPTPGAIALAAVTGIAATRRRRG